MVKINAARNDFTLNLVEEPVVVAYNQPEVQRELLDFVRRNAKIIKRVYINCAIPQHVLHEVLQTLTQHNKLQEVQDRTLRILDMEDQQCLYSLRKLWVRVVVVAQRL